MNWIEAGFLIASALILAPDLAAAHGALRLWITAPWSLAVVRPRGPVGRDGA